jgi:hypothetical protein
MRAASDFLFARFATLRRAGQVTTQRTHGDKQTARFQFGHELLVASVHAPDPRPAGPPGEDPVPLRAGEPNRLHAHLPGGTEKMSNDFFGEPIYSYTRQQAINDGVLVDLAQFKITRLSYSES